MGSNIIYNQKKLSRIIDFSNLPMINRTISPSDIDFIVEVSIMKKVMVGDTKEKGKKISTGQKILIENICKSFASNGYEAIGFLSYHNPDDNIIDMANTSLSIVYNFYPESAIWKWDTIVRRQKVINLYKSFFCEKEDY